MSIIRALHYNNIQSPAYMYYNSKNSITAFIDSEMSQEQLTLFLKILLDDQLMRDKITPEEVISIAKNGFTFELTLPEVEYLICSICTTITHSNRIILLHGKNICYNCREALI